MERKKDFKLKHVLGIYERLMNGYVITKAEEADRYGVSKKTIQRYIEAIRMYLADESEMSGVMNTVEYDRSAGGYRLQYLDRLKLSNSEILAVCKILLDSRAFTKPEMENILQKLVDCCVPEIHQNIILDMIRNEEFHYIEPRHHTVFLDTMWKLAQAVYECKYIEIKYRRLKGQELVKRKLMPVAILFSEYYFYLTAFIADADIKRHFEDMRDSFPTIYRIDRIKELTVLEERYRIPYKDRFEEGEFRKRVQFMFGGKLQKVKFKCSGMSVEAALDRLPTAKIVDEKDDVYTITAEVFGKGIEMWLKSQENFIELVEIKSK